MASPGASRGRAKLSTMAAKSTAPYWPKVRRNRFTTSRSPGHSSSVDLRRLVAATPTAARPASRTPPTMIGVAELPPPFPVPPSPPPSLTAMLS